MPPRVHLVRHGQRYHQLEPLEEHRQIHDPDLTELGFENCRKFNQLFPEYVHVDLMVASPMRRAIQTAAYCFADRIPRTTRGNILLQPLAQENTDLPCDVGSDRKVLEGEFGNLVDTSLVTEDWTTKEGVNAPTPDALKERARLLRYWLRDRQEHDVVVVGHGAFWDYVTNALDADGLLLDKKVFQEIPSMRRLTELAGPESTWANREWRFYDFASKTDEQATLVEQEDSIARRRVLNA